MIERTGPCPSCAEVDRQACRFCDPAGPDYIRCPDLSTPEGRNAYVYGRMGEQPPAPHRREDCRYTRCCSLEAS